MEEVYSLMNRKFYCSLSIGILDERRSHRMGMTFDEIYSFLLLYMTLYCSTSDALISDFRTKEFSIRKMQNVLPVEPYNKERESTVIRFDSEMLTSP